MNLVDLYLEEIYDNPGVEIMGLKWFDGIEQLNEEFGTDYTADQLTPPANDGIARTPVYFVVNVADDEIPYIGIHTRRNDDWGYHEYGIIGAKKDMMCSLEDMMGYVTGMN